MIERAIVGLLLGFCFSLALGPALISLLKERGAATFHWLKTDKDNTLFYELHQKKIGTPAMGGLLMLGGVVILSLILYPSVETAIFLFAFIAFSLLGFLDDVSKMLVKAGVRKDDFAAMPKFIAQWVLALGFGALLYALLGRESFYLPIFGSIWLGPGYIFLAALVIVTTTNAANITDGLDGLAGGLAVIALSAFCALAIARGDATTAGLCAILVGTTLGFLIYNVHPARVFMGDVGSMALGVGLTYAGLALDELLPLLVIAGIFAFEIVSSFVQKIALRRGRKVFKIAPFHHHLEALGWPETRITQTFWVIGIVLAFAGILVSRA